MRTIIRLAVAAFALSLFLPGAAPAGPKTAMQTGIEALAAQDPAFAASEKAVAEARAAFLARFSGTPRQWAEEFLNTATGISSSTLNAISGNDTYAQGEREKLLKKRKTIIRYLTLASQTPITDPAFLILLKPVCAQAAHSYSFQDKTIAEALAEYDAHMRDPFKDKDHYATRRVNGQYWAAITLPNPEVGSSSSDDRLMAFVMRLKDDGTFFLNPIIAPTQEDYYPREKYPLRPGKYENGPGGISINECTMESVLTVTNESGPFSFRADARQAFSGGGLSYACEPKCSGFTYAWNETTQSFIMEDGVCRDDDGWKPKSPFTKDNTLVPVDNYVRALAAEGNETVRNHRQDVETAAAAYLALFDGTAQELARAFVDGWKLDRQFPLYHLVGQKEAFAEAYVKNDADVLSYLNTLISLVKQPDSRLPLLLEDMAARRPALEKTKKEDRERERSPSARDLLRGGGKRVPWFASYAARQMGLLKQPEKKDSERSYGSYHYIAVGLDGSETITFTYNPKMFYSSYGEKPVTNTYMARRGSDGAFWGHASVAVGANMRDNYYRHYDSRNSEQLLPVARQTVLRVHEGKVAFLTPSLPEEKDFFTKPELDNQGAVLWTVPGKTRRYSGVCNSAPAFSVDTSSAPFAIRAKNTMINGRSYYTCIAECEIPYTWDGTAYVRSAPECLPEGQWGVRELE